MSASARSRAVKAAATLLARCGGMWPLQAAAGYLVRGRGLRLRYRRHPAFPVLSYHRVNDDRDPFFSALPTPVFDRHMAYVARTHRVLPVEELVERARYGTLPRNALAITFDDGYRDSLTHAAPILAKHRLPATIFLATGFVGTAEVPWFDRLARALKLTAAGAVTLPGGGVAELPDAGARLAALDRALAALKRLPDDDRRRALDGFLEQLGVTDQKCFKNLMLSWDDVNALAGLGFTIGAHTVNHPILSRVKPQRARDEIHGSRAMIESACGQAPRAFAYPNGTPADYTETVKHLVREAGFTCAVTTRFGINSRDTDPYELRRGGPWEHHPPTFALKLAAYRLMAS